MTKTLDKLWEKTQKSPNGYAFHKGRRSYWGGHKGPLEKVWEMELDDGLFHLYHYGTKILSMTIKTGKIYKWHIQSMTDAKALNWAFLLFGHSMKYKAHYYPSKGQGMLDMLLTIKC